MVDAIYRFTNSGDTYGTIANTEKMEFLPGNVPDNTGRNIATAFTMRRDVNPHPNPRRALNKIQDSLLGMMEVVVTGYFVNHNTTLGPKNFYNWQVGDGVNTDFPWGRFGLTIDSFAGGLLNETPDANKGYILYDIVCEDVEKPRDKVPFIAKFYRNGDITVKA
jgi:hypothetical protein